MSLECRDAWEPLAIIQERTDGLDRMVRGMWKEVARCWIHSKANRIYWHIVLGRKAVNETRVAPKFWG